MSTRSQLLFAALVAAVAAAGCGDSVEIVRGGPMGITDEPRTCTKDTQQILDIIDQIQQPTCMQDSDCPCGSNCDPDGFCVASCIATNDPSYPCPSGLVCDNWGQCVTATPPPTPTTLARLLVAPLQVTVDAPASGDWPTTPVTVSITMDATMAQDPKQQPKVVVSGATAIPAGCADDDPATPCASIETSELEVACESGKAFASFCTLDPPWTVGSADLGTAITRTVYVRPVRAAKASNWTLRFMSDRIADSPKVVSVSRRATLPVPFDGRYRGTLTLVGGDATQTLSLPVTAYARSGYVMLIDDARLLSPNGRMRLANGSVLHATWLAGASSGSTDATVDVTVDALAQDDKTGTLTGSFRLVLPYWAQSASGPRTSATLAWTFRLTRDDALPGPDCSSDAQCGGGASCDVAMRTCIPGGKFLQALTTSASDLLRAPALATNGATTALHLQIASPGHITADAAERFTCYAGSAAKPEAGLEWSSEQLEITGDQKCTTATAALVAPRSVRLVSVPDVAKKSFGDIFGDCLADLAASAAESEAGVDHPCVSLARLYPALSLLTSTATAHDRRGALLLERLVGEWAALQGFFARDGLQSWRLDLTTAGTPRVDPAKLLDTVAANWNLVLDAQVANALVTLPPTLLAKPDYRGSDRPRAYWTTSAGDAADVESGYTLQPDGSSAGLGSSWLQLPDGLFGHDLAAVFQTSYDYFESYQLNSPPYVASTGYGTVVIDSPWLSVRFEPLLSSLYEVGTMRTGQAWDEGSGLTWSGCLQKATSHHTYAWSWDPPTGRCWAYQTRGARTGWRAPFSASVRTGFLKPDAYKNLGAATADDGYDRWGSDYLVGPPTPYWQTCQSSCENDTSCVAWSWSKSSQNCYYKGAGKPFALKTPGNTVSGLSSRGRALESQLADAYRDGLTVLGADIRSFAANGWEDCVDACRQESGCEGWVWQKGARWCYLRRNLTGYQTNPLNASGLRGGIDLVVSHESARGVEIARTHLTDQLYTSASGADNSLAVVRDVATHTYRVYLDGKQAWLDKPFAELPYAPSKLGLLRLARATVNPTFAKVDAAALFDTALDDLEVAAIAQRTGSGGSVTRDVKRPPVTGANDEHGVGLPVSLVEGVEGELALLAGHVDAQGGAIDAECAAGGTTPTRDALLARAGDTFRKDAVLLSLADEMHERATHIECRGDDDCAAVSGARCGGGHVDIPIDALAMPRSGGMMTCQEWITPTTGICVPASAPSSLGAPGAAQATTTFSVATPGDYVVWGRLYARSAGSDSFWVRIDNGGWTVWEEGMSTDLEARPPAAGWTWSRAVAKVSLSKGSHSITVAAREAGTMLNELRVTDDLTLLAPSIHHDVCTDANGTPVKAPTSWDARWKKSRAAVDAARGSVMGTLSRLVACKNSLGIGADDLPLYFRDASGVNRYWAASDYLLGLTATAEAKVEQLYSGVESSWLAQQSDVYEVETNSIALQQRLDDIATSFESQLSDLCGVSMTTPGALLTAFAQGTLDVRSCFVQSNPTCQANFNGPIRNASAGCYRGQAGEALYAMNASAVSVDAAHQQLHDKQVEYEGISTHCAYLKNNAALVRAHYDHLEQMRRSTGILDSIVDAVDLAAVVFAPQATVEACANGKDGVGCPFKIFSSVLGGEEKLLGPSIDDENASFQAEMAKRDADEEERQCWVSADLARGAIKSAGLEIERAADEFAAAQARYLDALARIAQLAVQGDSALARERARSLVHPAFNYWLDRNINAYERQLAWTKRLLYMSLLAVEYESQVSTNLRAPLLSARTSYQISDVLTALRAFSSNTGVAGHRPNPQFSVLSLKKDILGFTGADDVARLREYLRDHAQRITDASGKVIGAGVRFAITPDLIGYPLLCGERTWSTNAVILTGQNLGTGATAYVRLMQENTFSSQWCGPGHTGSMQTASVRPAVNLFLPDGGSAFVDSTPWTASDIQAAVNPTTTTVPAGEITDFADHGLYGNYILVLTDDKLDLLQLNDVLLRFDYLAASHN